MNKLTIALAGALMAAGSLVANAGPNRVLVTNTHGQPTGFVIDRVDKVEFATVDGEVAADVEVHEVSATKLTVSIERTMFCTEFKIDVIPESIFSQLKDDLSIISYVNYYSPNALAEDFDHGELSGISLSAGSDYRVVTVGVDPYGVDCDVRSAKFSVPAAPVQGKPAVEFTVTDRQLREFSCRFTPNSDCKKYYCVAGEKGTMLQQYEQFAPMFGFTNINEMIEMWGSERTTSDVITWTGMNPNTDYEIYVAVKDKKGNFGEYQVFEVSTLSQGGEGEAEVTITPGKYILNDWGGQMLPSQFFKFTPNDQTSCYRFGVYTVTEYEKYKEEDIFSDLCKDPEMPMAYWFWYEEFETDYQIDPGTEVVVLAAGKNTNGDWGKVTKLLYTTPDKVSKGVAPLQSGRIQAPERIPYEKGKLPVQRKIGLKH